MLKLLKLSHFRKHVDREFEFGTGMNVLRGENEAGKSTCGEAFAYLCFGARALREPLESVVTYDCAVSKLRVEGVIDLFGVEYRAYRAKSGAEVTFGNERITGQNEVTAFFSKLFGVDAKMAGKLMLASQKSLADSITAGPVEAGQMIENLANLDIITRVAETIQEKLPCGVTTGVEGRITALRAQVEDQPVEDLAPLKLDIIVAEHNVVAAQKELDRLSAQRDQYDIEAAKTILADEKRLQAAIEASTYEITRIDRSLALEAPVAPDEAEIEQARAAVEAEKQYARAAALHAELVKAQVEPMWDKDLAALEAELEVAASKVSKAHEALAAVRDAIAELDVRLSSAQRDGRVKIAQLEGKLIKESSCAFCDKDLTDVPEVVQRNSEVGQQLEAARGALADLERSTGAERAHLVVERDAHTKSLEEAQEYLGDLESVVSINTRIENLYARAADFIAVERATVPGTWRWTGPQIGGERPDCAARLRALELRAREAVADVATRAEQQRQVDTLKQKREADVAARNALQVADARETIELADALAPQIVKAGDQLAGARSTLLILQNQLATKAALAEQAARALEQAKANLKAAEGELAEMQANNLLLKKVRAARPVIADKLWNIVLAGVSRHFTEVRGEPSVVTRADGEFKCNGRPAAGLSGSAQDSLGLAIRIALTKTFLPGVGFLQLDEPAAACSDARESRMLGMLAGLGFGQTILVTHSDLADAFADQIINV